MNDIITYCSSNASQLCWIRCSCQFHRDSSMHCCKVCHSTS